MRLRSVYIKTLYDRRHGLLWWSVGIGLLTITVLSVWPSVRDEYTKLVQNYPEGLLAFFGIEKGGLGTAAGYLQAELFGLMLPLMLIAYAIAAGSAATAGEREAGTLEFLLAQPVSRRRVLLEKLLGLCTSLLVITVVVRGGARRVDPRVRARRRGAASPRRDSIGLPARHIVRRDGFCWSGPSLHIARWRRGRPRRPRSPPIS